MMAPRLKTGEVLSDNRLLGGSILQNELGKKVSLTTSNSGGYVKKIGARKWPILREAKALKKNNYRIIIEFNDFSQQVSLVKGRRRQTR